MHDVLIRIVSVQFKLFVVLLSLQLDFVAINDVATVSGLQSSWVSNLTCISLFESSIWIVLFNWHCGLPLATSACTSTRHSTCTHTIDLLRSSCFYNCKIPIKYVFLPDSVTLALIIKFILQLKWNLKLTLNYYSAVDKFNLFHFYVILCNYIMENVL